MTNYNTNPWKGLDSYSYSDNSIFYGRNSETNALVDIIINNRFTILYGPSGVGKSSLLNAGVRPKLAEYNYFVVDLSMRQFDLRSDQSISMQILECIKKCAKEKHIEITPLVKGIEKDIFEDSLWLFFHTNEFWSEKNELLTPIVIVDQFEDIFKEEIREQAPEQFFNSLDELSNVVPPLSMRDELLKIETFRYNQSADFRFVFSLREDYLPRLDDYVYSLNIPELRKSRYGISLMNEQQAKEVILGPADGIVVGNVADEIIKILSIQNSHSRHTHRVEPFLLSLFMYRVHIEMIKRSLSSISEELISKIGADVVNEYYLESMKKISSKAMKHLENVLLTPKGHRDSISYDKLIESEKVTDNELKTLLDARIIKKNTINSVDRFEFTHDVLSKYAQKNRERRERNNKSRLIIGYFGSLLTLLLASITGWIMSASLTYISIPILIVSTIISTYGIFNIKLPYKRQTAILLSICALLGICINLSQIIPSIGYILYFAVCISSLYVLKKIVDLAIIRAPLIFRYSFIGYTWIMSFIIVPTLCFGYNIYNGMNYSRGDQFSSDWFYVKNKNGHYGLRDRFSTKITPQYDDTLYRINSDYIAIKNGKYGLLDSLFQIKMPMEFDAFIISNSTPYFYLDGKEVAENGLNISWNKLATENQKSIIRKIIRNMILVKGGEFKMGTDVDKIARKISGFKPINGEEHIHQVYLSDYYINKYEVTLEDWIGIMDFDPRKRPPKLLSDTINNPNLPVYKISYEESQKFIEKIGLLSGLAFSLPTEAQWEYAARGGEIYEDFDFSGSNSEFDIGWIGHNSDHVPHEVGTKRSNSLGIYDMTGNVAEFCKDCMSQTFYIESKGQLNPCCNRGELLNSKKMIVLRGGSYESFHPEQYIVTRRIKARVDLKFKSTGFRLAISHNCIK